MKPKAIWRTFAALAAAVALAASGTPAFASGFQLAEQNASGLGNAFAGQAAVARDASTVYFNPAGMTRLEGVQLAVAAHAIGLSNTFADSGSTRPSLGGVTFPVPLGTPGGDAGGWIPIPNAYLSAQLSDALWLGLGVNVPFGLKTEWESDFMGRFHAVLSEVQTINVNPAIAFKVTDNLSLSAGASYQHLKAELSQSVPYGGIAVGVATSVGGAAAAGAILSQLGGASGLTLEGVGDVEGDGSRWGWNAGALLSLEKVRLGASYRSRVKHEIEGDAVFDGAPTFATSGVPAPIAAIGGALNARFQSGPVKAEIELPDTFSAAIAIEPSDRVEVLADWTWTGWSTIQSLDINRDDDAGTLLSSVTLKFQDTWRAGLGVNYRLNESLRLRLGTAYDKAPVQDQYRTPRLPDSDRVWAAGGLEIKIGAKGAIDVGYLHVFIDEGSSNLPNQETATSPPRGDLVGTYQSKVDVVSVQYRHAF